MPRNSGVMALAITPPGVLETFRFLKRLQLRFETELWLGPYRAADEYTQLWKRQYCINCLRIFLYLFHFNFLTYNQSKRFLFWR